MPKELSERDQFYMSNLWGIITLILTTIVATLFPPLFLIYTYINGSVIDLEMNGAIIVCIWYYFVLFAIIASKHMKAKKFSQNLETKHGLYEEENNEKTLKKMKKRIKKFFSKEELKKQIIGEKNE